MLTTIPVDRPAYMHSFGMTERYLILTEFPLVVNPLKLLLSGKPFIRNYAWQPDRGVRFHVIDKANAHRRWLARRRIVDADVNRVQRSAHWYWAPTASRIFLYAATARGNSSGPVTPPGIDTDAEKLPLTLIPTGVTIVVVGAELGASNLTVALV